MALKIDVRSYVPDRISVQAKMFLSASILNGFGNGMVNVVFQLYLATMGFESKALGMMSMMNALGTAIVTIPAGVIADRYGKKRIMIAGFVLMISAISLILIARTGEMFMAAFFLIGLSNATFVPLTPLYSSFFEDGDMDRAFGLYGFLNIVSMSLGSLIGHLHPILVDSYGFSLQSSYWTVIALGALFIALQTPLYLLSLKGVDGPSENGGFSFTLRSRGVVAKFFIIYFISVLGTSTFFSLFPFYVNKKFGVKSDALGTLFFLSNFVSAGANAVSPRLSKRLGTLRCIVLTIALATPFYFLIPLSSSFAMVSAAYILRLGLRYVADPLTTSLYMRLLSQDEKSTANSMRMMAQQAGNIVAPPLGGQLMETNLDLPAYVGASSYVILVLSFYTLLRGEEEKTTPAMAQEIPE
jgi:MFS family permease